MDCKECVYKLEVEDDPVMYRCCNTKSENWNRLYFVSCEDECRDKKMEGKSE